MTLSGDNFTHNGDLFVATFRINRSRLCAAAPDACVEGSQNQGANNFKIEYDFDLQNDVAFKPNEMMECYMRSNDPTCPAFTCFEALVTGL